MCDKPYKNTTLINENIIHFGFAWMYDTMCMFKLRLYLINLYSYEWAMDRLASHTRVYVWGAASRSNIFFHVDIALKVSSGFSFFFVLRCMYVEFRISALIEICSKMISIRFETTRSTCWFFLNYFVFSALITELLLADLARLVTSYVYIGSHKHAMYTKIPLLRTTVTVLSHVSQNQKL